MLEYDPVSSLQHHPTPNLKRFGVNPYGEPLYRIVFAASRRHLVGGCWADGEWAYHWVPKYKHAKSAWILERWDVERLSKAEWDRTMVDPVSGWLLFGPYPSRGDYDLAWEFDKGVAADSLDNIVGAIERGRTYSFQDVRDAVASDYAYDERDSKQQAEQEVRDACRYRGNAPLSFGRHGRGTKTVPELRSAEELGLPVPRQTKRNPRDLRGLDVTSTLRAGQRSAA